MTINFGTDTGYRYRAEMSNDGGKTWITYYDCASLKTYQDHSLARCIPDDYYLGKEHYREIVIAVMEKWNNQTQNSKDRKYRYTILN